MRRFFAAVLLCALLAACAAGPEPETPPPVSDPSAGQSASEPDAPELPVLDSVQALDTLTPADFGCFMTEHPTERDSYTLLPGEETAVTVQVLAGAEDGPAIYVVGGTHGDELAGWYAGLLLKKADVQAGTVYIAAPLNRYGAEHDRRQTRGGWDLNRHFPGDPEGNEAQRLAAALFEDIRDKQPALVLDLHEARLHTDGRDNLGGSVICQDMSLIDELVFSLLTDSDGGPLSVSRPLTLYGSPPEGSLNRTVTEDLGIPVLTVETDRTLPLNLRVQDHLRLAECVFLWYNIL